MNRKIALKELKLDDKYQVRRKINEWHVSKLCEVLRSGTDFKDQIVVLPDNTLLCGFGRVAAYAKVFGDDKVVTARVYKAKDFADAYQFAIQDNIQHGFPLYEIDKQFARETLLAEDWKDNDISKLLCVSLSRFQQWDKRKVYVSSYIEGDTVEQEEEEKKMPVKRDEEEKKMPVKQGTGVPNVMTARQYSSHLDHHACSTLFHINKIRARIRDVTIETDENTIKGLEALGKEIQDYLK